MLIILIENIVFWNGIIRIYMTSVQLGVRWRVLGIACGWIPVAHLIVLSVLIQTAEKEVCRAGKAAFEPAKDMIDLNRENFDYFDVREFYVQLVKGLEEKGF